jgi:predicted nuclease of predicted toxin-antitoxin system
LWTFVVDEDMPRSTAVVLRQANHAATDVRDLGLRGHADDEIFAYAQTHNATLITADLDFANVLRFPPGTHTGIVVMRVPNELPTALVNQVLLQALAELTGEGLRGLLVVVEIHRIRIRRP